MSAQADPPPGNTNSRPSLYGVALVFIFALAAPAPGQGRDQELADLKARLALMEQQIDRLARQNEALQKRLEQPSAVLYAPQEDPGEITTLIAQYLAREAEKKKTAKPPAEPQEYQVGANLKVEGSWRNALTFTTPDKAFRWTVGGVTQFDMSWFGGERPIVQSIGQFNNFVDPGQTLQDGMDLRRARLRFSGLLWEQVEFFAQYEFAQALDLRRRTLGISPAAAAPTNDFDPGDAVGFNEVYFGLVQLPAIGNVRFGRQRESLNFVTATSDNNQVWMERGLMFDAFNGDFNFSNGVTMQRTYLNDRAYTLLGLFQANNNSSRAFFARGDGEYAYDARVTCLPYYEPDGDCWLHLGLDYSYRNPHQEQLRYRARPMIRSGPGFLSPNVLNTGTIFTRDAQQIANLEFAMARGRFTLATEAAASWVTNAHTGGLPLPDGRLPPGVRRHGTYLATGGYVEALCFLTPDHRGYLKERPGYDRVAPRQPFHFINGEHGHILTSGAWEVGVRYDWLDLSDSGINGGMGNAVSLCLNWYLNPNARIQWNYFVMNRRFAPADALGRVNGDIDGLGVRFNVDY